MPLEELISPFQPISLSGMDSVKLMTRSDEKYVCRIDQLPGILRAAQPDFQILQHQGNRLFGYKTLYLDTPEREMYLMHHNAKLNRYKIRIREYTHSREFFFEIKFKDNHRVMTKKRIPAGPGWDYHSGEITSFLSENSPYTPGMLEPALYSSFRRITLVNTGIRERITIDLDPTWRHGDQHVTISPMVILEVKSTKSSNSKGFGLLLREARIFPLRLSKYCIGTALLFPEIKHNRFKAKLLHLDKLDQNIPHNESSHTISQS